MSTLPPHLRAPCSALPTRAFTLMELLIVISVIAVLAGLLFPAVGMIKRQALQLKDANNLKQLALGIETFRQDHEDNFPPSLNSLFDKSKGDYFEAGLAKKVLICPADPSKGMTEDFNRTPSSWSQLKEIWRNEQVQGQPKRPCSYLYECSGTVLLPGATGGNKDNGYIGWFSYTDHELAAGSTWAQGKRNQQKFGNIVNNAPASFAPSALPIVRCFWHRQWADGSDDLVRRVLAISWECNVFWTIPKWEYEASNGTIPLN